MLKGSEMSLKDQANALFQSQKYHEAYSKYTEAIKEQPTPQLYGNRSFASLKMENYGDAIADAQEAITLDPSFVKAYYRRASANLALCKYKESLRDFKHVVKCSPSDKDAYDKMTAVDRLVKRIEFEKALAYEHPEEKSVVEQINFQDMTVDDGYDGVRWEDESPLTEEFLEDMLTRFKAEKRIHKKYVFKLLLQALELLKAEKTIVDVVVPEGQILTVCGDTHGQFYDLMNIFKMNGRPGEKMYLFNGDVVDRGSYSLECILTLLAYKVLMPDKMYISRGNHETNDMNKVYGFEGEVKAKHSSELMMRLFSEVFCALPLGNLIEKKALVIHGGLFSRDDVTIEELQKINRFKQPPSSVTDPKGLDLLMTELLWSDPMPTPGRAPSKRGVALQFGPDVTERFCKLNNLDLIIRSHEVRDGGYAIEHDGRCVTVFSAPNYCDQVGNKGAYINIKKMNQSLDYRYAVFEAVSHPPSRAMQYANAGMRGF